MEPSDVLCLWYRAAIASSKYLYKKLVHHNDAENIDCKSLMTRTENDITKIKVKVSPYIPTAESI